MLVIAAALYRINTTTGAATKVADTDFGLITITGVNGVIYGFSGTNGQVVTLDVTNGNTNVVSDLDPSLGLIGGAAAVPGACFDRSVRLRACWWPAVGSPATANEMGKPLTVWSRGEDTRRGSLANPVGAGWYGECCPSLPQIRSVARLSR